MSVDRMKAQEWVNPRHIRARTGAKEMQRSQISMSERSRRVGALLDAPISGRDFEKSGP
jgi:hypothetical protein